jgi:hypothetical protein
VCGRFFDGFDRGAVKFLSLWGQEKLRKMVNVHLQRAILEIVENQIRENEPPETKETFERLLKKGYSEEDAKKLIGTAVVTEIFHVLKRRSPYDEKRYIEALKKL